ncbi:PDR/VanB family oxidoreductase [Pseudaestuariivita sp.]|uniref:PDR/VanB family oxidoreductase n=1 Tax=Pseudaestuariivita sp. TaxID=2211669 RepID=UPI0040590864
MIELEVAKRRQLTETITEFTLTPADAAALPGFTPGAHITVQTPSGAMRRYSLVNDGSAPDSYVIALKREPASRGGSASMHDVALEGTRLQVEPPQNDFALQDTPEPLLIAGGIGVTPILSMARHLTAQQKPFRVIYCSRSAEEAAYLDELTAMGPHVTVHHDHGDFDEMYDFWDHFETPQAHHVYCCGPAPLMEEIKAMCGHWPEGRVVFEDFKPVEAVKPDDTPFAVTLRSSGQTVDVPADRTILEALRDAGIATASSCESGTCGTCKCTLVAGEADHRDMVLMDEEKTSRIMICVSRAKSAELVLDL